MMHLALGHAYQNDLDPSDACNSYHQELVVEFNPPLAWQRAGWSDVTKSYSDYDFLRKK